MLGTAIRRCALTATRSLCTQQPAIRLLPSQTLSSRIIASNSLALRRTFAYTAIAQQEAVAEEKDVLETVLPGEDDAPATKFQELVDRKLVSSAVMKAVTKDMRLDQMTEVQSQTLNAALTGKDIVGQAKTGTGKTLAFLLPIMEGIIRDDPSLVRTSARRHARSDDIRGIIISPTRELAEQIAAEAEKLARYTGIKVQCAVGGSHKASMLHKTQREGCHLLVGTPGRLDDLLSDPSSGIAAPNLATFVLDEADRLLDQGFLPAIEQIKRLLPDLKGSNRQTMMMSATISHEVVDLVRTTLRPGFKFVQCVDPNEAPTHARVPQKVVITPGMENMTLGLYELAVKNLQGWEKGEIDRPFKAIVFFNSGYEAMLHHQVFRALKSGPDRQLFKNTPIIQIHSKLSQAQRTTSSEAFRAAESGILLSTDVTARGLDFPNVTHVIQVGYPNHGGRESYIHRLGRTARAGKEGEGWIFIPQIDRRRAEKGLTGLPLQIDNTLETANVRLAQPTSISGDTSDIINKVKDAFRMADPEDLKSVYQAYLGVLMQADSQAVVDMLNDMSEHLWGLEEPPAIAHGFALKNGYSKCRGINIAQSNRGFGGGRPGGFGGRDGGDRFGGDRFGGDRSGGDRFGGDRSRGRNDGFRDRGGRDEGRSSGFGGRDRGGRDEGRSSGFGGRGRGGSGGRY